MAFSEIELKRNERDLEAFLAQRRPPPHVRHQIDLRCHINGQSIEFVEVRPHWKDPNRSIETPIAKATYVRTQKCWKLYWMRRDLKWHGYEPAPAFPRLAGLLAVVARDEFGCFFG